MHKLTFYPLGNGETLLLTINDAKKLVLIDYADRRDPNDKYDLRCDLPSLLREQLGKAKREYFNAVAFTHLDDDHVKGASDFFYLEHAVKYQSSDRIKIEELWVPAAAIVESNLDGDALVLRSEARYRLKQGKGIRVFSAPDTLADWFQSEGLDLNEYQKKGLVVNAGQLVPSFSLLNDGVEFFIHSPFASRTDDGKLHVRNTDAIVFQAVFQVGSKTTKALITADVPYLQLEEMIDVTTFHKRDERLEWDIYDAPHHSSYTALGPEKGKDKTEATEKIKSLMKKGNRGGLIISSSEIIPTVDTDQPPHRQAAEFYKEVAGDIGGEYVVTMEHPKKSEPKPLEIEITTLGAKLIKPSIAAVGMGAVSQSAHRVG